MTNETFDDGYAARQIARRDNAWRARVRQVFLDRIRRHVEGPTVDIGCGAGQLLAQLPPGSVGLEINPSLLKNLVELGMTVLPVEPDPGVISLGTLQPGVVRTAVLSHVLEHFDDAAAVLRRLMDDCRSLGITRLIVVVPGRVGYASDSTHRTFVTVDYLRRHGLLEGPGFDLRHRSYFPGNLKSFGRFFVYHELMLVYDLSGREE